MIIGLFALVVSEIRFEPLKDDCLESSFGDNVRCPRAEWNTQRRQHVPSCRCDELDATGDDAPQEKRKVTKKRNEKGEKNEKVEENKKSEKKGEREMVHTSCSRLEN